MYHVIKFVLLLYEGENMKQKNKFAIVFFIMALSSVLLCGCGTRSKPLVSFSIGGDESCRCVDERTIYVTENCNTLKLKGNINITGGKAALQITDNKSGNVVWENEFSESSDFIIEMHDLKKESSYLVKVEGDSTQKIDVKIEKHCSLKLKSLKNNSLWMLIDMLFD